MMGVHLYRSRFFKQQVNNRDEQQREKRLPETAPWRSFTAPFEALGGSCSLYPIRGIDVHLRKTRKKCADRHEREHAAHVARGDTLVGIGSSDNVRSPSGYELVRPAKWADIASSRAFDLQGANHADGLVALVALVQIGTRLHTNWTFLVRDRIEHFGISNFFRWFSSTSFPTWRECTCTSWYCTRSVPLQTEVDRSYRSLLR